MFVLSIWLCLFYQVLCISTLMLSRFKPLIAGQEWERRITTAFCRNTAVLIRNPHAGVVNEGTGYMPHLNTWPFPIADGVLSAWLWKLELGDKCYKQMYAKR